MLTGIPQLFILTYSPSTGSVVYKHITRKRHFDPLVKIKSDNSTVTDNGTIRAIVGKVNKCLYVQCIFVEFFYEFFSQYL